MSPSSQVPFGLIDAQSSFLHMVTFPDGTTEKGGLKGQSRKRKDMGGHVRIVSCMDCRKHDQPCVRPLVSMSTVAKWLKHQKGSVVLLRRCVAARFSQDFQLRKMSQLQQWANGAMWLQEKYASRCFKLQDAYLFIYTVIHIYIIYVFIVNLIFYWNLIVMSNILKRIDLVWGPAWDGAFLPMTKAIVCLEILSIKQVNLHMFTLPCKFTCLQITIKQHGCWFHHATTIPEPAKSNQLPNHSPAIRPPKGYTHS